MGNDWDVYLYLLATAHGSRYWIVGTDDWMGGMDDTRLAAFGPALIGPGGYASDEEAADAIAHLEGFDLDDPSTWPES